MTSPQRLILVSLQKRFNDATGIWLNIVQLWDGIRENQSWNRVFESAFDRPQDYSSFDHAQSSVGRVLNLTESTLHAGVHSELQSREIAEIYLCVKNAIADCYTSHCLPIYDTLCLKTLARLRDAGFGSQLNRTEQALLATRNLLDLKFDEILVEVEKLLVWSDSPDDAGGENQALAQAKQGNCQAC